MPTKLCDEEWVHVSPLLPDGWRDCAKECGALLRTRGVADADSLMRLLMLHISGGLSLEQSVLRAAELGLAKVSAVALFKRLRAAGPWLEKICAGLIASNPSGNPDDWPLKGRRIRAFDASDIREPGATGTSWRLHYAVTLPGLRCDHAEFTTRKTGERLQNFPVSPGDVILADRIYGRRNQIAWLVDSGADAVIRLNPPGFPAEDADETDLPVDWLERLEKLPKAGVSEFPIRFTHDGKTYRARICVIRKSQTAAGEARRKIELEARKKGRTPGEKTLRLADFIVVLTTLPRRVLSAARVLDLYRCRWQVELAFKRLKSLLEMSSVPKSVDECARAWMQGKLLEALLVEKLLEQSGALSPWGYRIGR